MHALPDCAGLFKILLLLFALFGSGTRRLALAVVIGTWDCLGVYEVFGLGIPSLLGLLSRDRYEDWLDYEYCFLDHGDAVSFTHLGHSFELLLCYDFRSDVRLPCFLELPQQFLYWLRFNGFCLFLVTKNACRAA
jgi:hypothetical protein